VMTNLKTREGLAEVVRFIETRGLLTAWPASWPSRAASSAGTRRQPGPGLPESALRHLQARRELL